MNATTAAAPAPARRRISYVLGNIEPDDRPVRLALPAPSHPRATAPLLSALPDSTASAFAPAQSTPRHRLPVSALALDTSTVLLGQSAPRGILYTGGRDGQLIAWDLNLPLRAHARRAPVVGHYSRWEYMTGWADEAGDDPDDSALPSDGDILGDVKGSARRRRGSAPSSPGTTPSADDEPWQLDGDAFVAGTPSTFRQSAQAHTDWVNDIALTRDARTLVSAGSDGCVKLWRPHDAALGDPELLGMHTDYARCLALPRAHAWAASGSFDRTIKLWDLTRANGAPLLTLSPPESAGPKASVYALASDPLGHTLVSGGPERVVRMWDPRAGRRVGKLVGHTDNIRAILVSDDARYLLTASADASIKLWSLASQRCLHTFTHHTDSVWALHSTHPTLQIFYSGDKSGQLARVDAEACTDMADAECLSLAQASSDDGAPCGIDKLASTGDGLVWATAGGAALPRWRAPRRRVDRAAALSAGAPSSPRADGDGNLEPILSRRPVRRALTVDVPPPPPAPASRLAPRHAHSLSLPPPPGAGGAPDEPAGTSYGVPFDSLVRLTGPHDPFGLAFSPGARRDADVATLYSAASVHSVPAAHRLGSIFPTLAASPGAPGRAGSPVASELTQEPDMPGVAERTPRAAFERRDALADAVPLESEPDVVLPGGGGLVRAVLLSDRVHALAVDARARVSAWDVARGACVGVWARADVAGAWARAHSEGADDGEGGDAGSGALSPREALEFVRARVEGEAVVPAWCSVEARCGVLTVHINDRAFEAEVYADEAGAVVPGGEGRGRPEDVRVNLGKWVLRNLFAGFVREELRLRAGSRAPSPATPPSAGASSPPASSVAVSPTLIRAAPRAPVLPPLPPPVAARFALQQPLSPIVQSPSDWTPKAHPRAPSDAPATTPSASASNGGGDYFSMRARGASVSSSAVPVLAPPALETEPSEPGTPLAAPASASVSTPASAGFMNRLKGKMSRRGAPDAAPAVRPTTATAVAAAPADAGPALSPAQALLASAPLAPPNTTDAGPALRLPGAITVLVTEEHAAGWAALWRARVGGMCAGGAVGGAEAALPLWALEFLLFGRAPAVGVVKLGFVLLPHRGDGEPLPEVLNTAQSKLTASRFLRVRKLCGHVQDRMERLAAGGGGGGGRSARSSIDAHSVHGSIAPAAGAGRAPEELWEMLCQDRVLPLDMTLAAVRQFVWRQPGELVVHYRRRRADGPPLPSGPGLAV